MSASAAAAAVRPAAPKWQKPVLISSIVFVVVGVVIVVALYFSNVLMPRYKCGDADTGACVGTYSGSYKTKTCDNKCSSSRGKNTRGSATGHNCVEGTCTPLYTGTGAFGPSDSTCGGGCFTCNEDVNVGGATAITTTAATKRPDPSELIVVADGTLCAKMYSCQGGECTRVKPAKGQFKDATCNLGCHMCDSTHTCVAVKDGSTTGYLADCKDPDCGGPYKCVKSADGNSSTCEHAADGEFQTLKQCDCSNTAPHVTNLTLAPLDNKWSKSGNDGGYIQNNVLVKLGEFSLHTSSTCAVTINGGVSVKIGDGSGQDSMIVTILVIDKNAYDSNQHGATFPFTSQYNNTIATTADSNNILNLFNDKAVVVAGKIPSSTSIDKSELFKMSRNTPTTAFKLATPTVKLPTGYYWVIAYFGVSTDDTVQVNLLTNSNVTFSHSCD